MRLTISFILLLISTHLFSQRQHIIFESGFEDTSLSEWNQIERCSIDRVSTSTIVKKNGSRSGRFYSKAVDSLGCTLVRSEVIYNDVNSINFDRWYGLSAYMNNTFPTTYDGVEFFLEFLRRDTVEEYPPLALEWQGYEQAANTNWPAGNYINTYMVRRTQPPATPYTIFINPLRPIVYNQWFDIVMHIKWSNDTTGLIRIWVNDYLCYSYDGVTNYGPNRLRLGIDKWDWRRNWHVSNTTEREIYIDEFRIGDGLATYMDVKPGSTIALPVHWYIFSASRSNNNVNLYWEAEFGINFNKFIVERDIGIGWQQIGQVSYNLSKRYTYVDNQPKFMNKYRIRALSIGESDSYTDVQTVLLSENNRPVKIYVYNSIGQLVKVHTTTLQNTNINDIIRQLNIYISGIYILRYENGQTQKIFISK